MDEKVVSRKVVVVVVAVAAVAVDTVVVGALEATTCQWASDAFD